MFTSMSSNLRPTVGRGAASLLQRTHLPSAPSAQLAECPQSKGSCRWKHSSTQIKRFRNHPGRLRVEARMGIERKFLPLPERQFPQIFEANFLPNGWSAPPGPDFQVPEYPFAVKRTKNKPYDAVGFLPVYAKHR